MAGSFIRVKLLQILESKTPTSDPYCAINVKEVLKQDGGDTKLVQKKKTFNPEWGKCFDSHLLQGRRLQILVMDRGQGDAIIGEVSVEVSAIADQCRSTAFGSGVAKMAVSTLHSFSFSYFFIFFFFLVFPMVFSASNSGLSLTIARISYVEIASHFHQ